MLRFQLLQKGRDVGYRGYADLTLSGVSLLFFQCIEHEPQDLEPAGGICPQLV